MVTRQGRLRPSVQADYGLYKVYGVLATLGGDKALVEFAGTWDVVTKDGKLAKAPFQAEG